MNPPPPRAPYETVNPVFDDLGNRICRGCHTRIYRAEVARKWPRYCSTACLQWEGYQKLYARARCQCGKHKEKYSRVCPDCREREELNRPLRTLRKRLARYGLTLERATSLMEAQGSCCPICRTGIDWGSCHIDHDHACCPQHPSDNGTEPICGNCVRGFLCPTCNVGLGSFKDDPVRLTSAVAYLSQVSIPGTSGTKKGPTNDRTTTTDTDPRPAH